MSRFRVAIADKWGRPRWWLTDDGITHYHDRAKTWGTPEAAQKAADEHRKTTDLPVYVDQVQRWRAQA